MADETCTIYYDYTCPILLIFLTITILPTLRYLIKSKTQNLNLSQKQQDSQFIFCTSILFFSIIILYYIDLTIGYLHFCRNQAIWAIVESIDTLCYLIQGVLFVSILFTRLIHVVRPTSYRLSKYTISLYFGNLILAVIIFIVSAICIITDSSPMMVTFGLYGFVIALFMYILTMLWLNGLFIKKAFQIYESSEDEEIKAIITKTALLCFVSCAGWLVSIVMSYLCGIIESDHFLFASRLVLFAHLYTNYLSVLLSYNEFRGWYMRICGCCDIKCRVFWQYIATRNSMDENVMKEITDGQNVPDHDMTLDGMEEVRSTTQEVHTSNYV